LPGFWGDRQAFDGRWHCGSELLV